LLHQACRKSECNRTRFFWSTFSNLLLIAYLFPDAPHGLKISQCTPLFQVIYRLRSGARHVHAVCSHRLFKCPSNLTLTLCPHAIATAGAVIHSHAICSVLASQFLAQDSVFRCTELEMIKGISGHSYTDTLTVRLCDAQCCLSVTLCDPAGAHHREHGPRMRPRRFAGGTLPYFFLLFHLTVSSFRRQCDFTPAPTRSS
jgi:hypothetical protein